MSARRSPEELRAAIEADLDGLGWACSDAELAADHGCSATSVRSIRAERARSLRNGEAEQCLARLAALVEWPGTRTELLLEVLDGALARAEGFAGTPRFARRRALLEAVRDLKRQRELEGRAAAEAAE
jgi:hypothetical protein